MQLDFQGIAVCHRLTLKPFDSMTDIDLIRAAQSGDAQAFEQLLQRYYDTIFRFALKWCGVVPDAEDIAQQVCIKLGRNLGQFRFESAFSSWLYRMVINTAKDWHTANRRHQSAQAEAEVEDVEAKEVPQAASGESLIMLRQLLAKAETWGEGFRETLLLVNGEGLTHAEAAEVLGVKESTISWRLYEIRKHLLQLQSEG